MADVLDTNEFFYQDKPRSVSEAVAQGPHGREINVVKATVQGYISKWLIPGTFQNKLLLDHAPQLSRFVQNREGARNIHFDIDHTWSEIDEANSRKVQVARYIEDLRRRLPAILIMDGGYRNLTAGLGDIQGGRMIGGFTFDFDVAVSLNVTIEIMVLADDDSTCNDLCTLLTSTLGPPLRRFGNGNHISGGDINNPWQVCLPLSNDMSALNRENLSDDPKDSIWSASTSIEVLYDGTNTLTSGYPVKRGFSSMGEEGGSVFTVVGADNPDLGNLVAFGGPSQLSLRHPARFPVIITPSGTEARLKGQWRLFTSDARIAVIDPRTMVVRGRSLGTVTLKILDQDNSIVTSKTIEVVP